MSLPLIRLAIGRTNGTAHYGVLLTATEFVTACASHSPDLAPIAEHTAHTLCQSCARAWLILTTPQHPGEEPEARPAIGTGASATGHRPIPGHLMGYCGKPLDPRTSPARRVCANCTAQGAALARLQRLAGELRLPDGDPSHVDDRVLWAPSGRGNLVTGHRRDALLDRSWCGQRLSGPNPGASNECAPCRQIWQEAEVTRQTYTLPQIRERAHRWPQRRDLDMFDDRAGALRPGDAYTLSGCEETHHVVAAADRSRSSHTDLVVYLPAADRIADVRVRGECLVTIQRPPCTQTVLLHPAPRVS
ncbi:hypothetical protein ACFYN0_01040 [Streptomyces sp. NPDC006704]|uniref:hypothetical protein n=1 Tax=Streptomyces sp. NPDC006704 TaxID=3364760 RepID=UPI0036CF935F